MIVAQVYLVTSESEQRQSDNSVDVILWWSLDAVLLFDPVDNDSKTTLEDIENEDSNAPFLQKLLSG